MAKRKDPPASLQPLDDAVIKLIKEAVDKIETIEEKVAMLTADKRAVIDRIGAVVEPKGYEKKDIVGVVARRKKSRDKVTGADLRIHRIEVAMGMVTADLFADQALLLKTSQTAASATDASLAAGNAAAELDKQAGKKTHSLPKDGDVAKTVTVEVAAVAESSASVAVTAEKAKLDASIAECEKIRSTGLAAWARGAKADENPHPKNSREAILWCQGWDEAQEEWDAENTAAPSTPAGNVVAMKAKPTGRAFIDQVTAPAQAAGGCDL